MNNIYILSFVFISILATNAFAYKRFDTNILHECKDNIRITGIKAECNDMYHHYPSLTGYTQNYDDVKIAGFNVLNMTTGESRFKDLDIITDIINQWDVIGMVEVLPAMGEDAKINDYIRKQIKAKKLTFTQAKDLYRRPGYLKVLNLLRDKWPGEGWAMLLAPYSQSKTQELVAYYYRGSFVEPVATSHCKNQVHKKLKNQTVLTWTMNGKIKYKKAVRPAKAKAYGCIPHFPKKTEQRFSRIPFMASFKAGEFDFTLLSMHARFRASGAIRGNCKKACQENTKQLLDEEFDPKGKIVPAMKNKLLGRIIRQVKEDIRGSGKVILNSRERNMSEVRKALKIDLKILERRASFLVSEKLIARFYETKKILKLIKSMKRQKEKDIIIVGDFNLEMDERSRGKIDYWENLFKVLPGSELFVEDRTSVRPSSFKDGGLKSNYDHFLFNPENVNECNPITARSFNFLSEETFEEAGVPYKLGQYLSDNYMFDEQGLLDEYRESLEGTYIMPNTKLKKITETEINKRIEVMGKRVFENQYNEKKDQEVFIEVISDHLPISMSCSITESDDD